MFNLIVFSNSKAMVEHILQAIDLPLKGHPALQLLIGAALEILEKGLPPDDCEGQEDVVGLAAEDVVPDGLPLPLGGRVAEAADHCVPDHF